MLVSKIKSTLKSLGIRPSKALGQHFLLDEKTLLFIVEQAEIGKGGGPHPAKASRGRENVLEIGPGLGFLTEALARAGANVVAVEKDKVLARYLTDRFHNWRNVTIVPQDALFFDPSRLTPYKLVANLPYSITAPVLRRFLEHKNPPSLIVVMVQKEHGERIVARPGDPNRGVLSVMVQFFGQPEIIGHVARSKFWSQPDVDSVILRISDIRHPVSVHSKAFFAVVKAGFSQKRAQIHNALRNSLHLPDKDISFMLDESGIDPTNRAEELTIEEWGKLAHAFQKASESSQTPTHPS